MEWVPAGKCDTGHEPCPLLLTATWLQPEIGVDEPSAKNANVPAPLLGLTVAVKITVSG